MVAVFAEAADAHVHVNAGPLIHHPERNGTGRAVFVAGDLLGVDVIDPLILGGFATEGKALADIPEHPADALSQRTGEHAGFRGRVIDKFSGFGADLRHLALIHDEHTLAVRYRNHGAGGDNIFIALGVDGTACDLLPALDCQNIRRNGFAVKIFLPLIGQYAACRAGGRFDESHMSDLLSGVQFRCTLWPLYRIPHQDTRGNPMGSQKKSADALEMLQNVRQ